MAYPFVLKDSLCQILYHIDEQRIAEMELDYLVDSICRLHFIQIVLESLQCPVDSQPYMPAIASKLSTQLFFKFMYVVLIDYS
jgi:hypothetical protein